MPSKEPVAGLISPGPEIMMWAEIKSQMLNLLIYPGIPMKHHIYTTLHQNEVYMMASDQILKSSWVFLSISLPCPNTMNTSVAHCFFLGVTSITVWSQKLLYFNPIYLLSNNHFGSA